MPSYKVPPSPASLKTEVTAPDTTWGTGEEARCGAGEMAQPLGG